MPSTDLPESELEEALRPIAESLGWSWANCYHEKLGPKGDFGRDNLSEWYLPNRLRAAIQRLNPALPPTALDEAYEQLTRDRSALSLVRANQDLYALLRDGVEVTVHLDDGSTEPAR